MQSFKNRLRKLETATQPKTGLLPIVVDDQTPASEILRLRNQNPGRTVIKFSDSVDHFL